MAYPRDAEYDAWVSEAHAANRLEIIEKLGFNLKRNGVEWAGYCLVCQDGKDRFSVNTAKNVFHCRGCFPKNNIIQLVMDVLGEPFLTAVEFITGNPAPKGKASETPAKKAERERALALRQAEFKDAQRMRDAAETLRQENTLKKYIGYYHVSKPIHGSPVQDYLKIRGIHTLPEHTSLRYLKSLPYYDEGKVLHRGDVMIAPFINAEGSMVAFHLTYIDLEKPNGKVALEDKDKNPLPSKKIQGKFMGCYIPLAGLPLPFNKTRKPLYGMELPSLCIGEGIETTLTAWLAGADLYDGFWAAGSLINLSGKAADSVPHPLDPNKKIPGETPDYASTMIEIPRSTKLVCLLQDGDSDEYKTTNDMRRAAKRLAQNGAKVKVQRPPEKCDFNDLLKRAA